MTIVGCSETTAAKRTEPHGRAFRPAPRLAAVLRVYSSRDELPEGEPHVLALAPLWGRPTPSPWPHPDYADALAASGVFVEAELAEADVAIYPRDWKHVVATEDGQERAVRFAARARAAGVRSAFFWA